MKNVIFSVLASIAMGNMALGMDLESVAVVGSEDTVLAEGSAAESRDDLIKLGEYKATFAHDHTEILAQLHNCESKTIKPASLKPVICMVAAGGLAGELLAAGLVFWEGVSQEEILPLVASAVALYVGVVSLTSGVVLGISKHRRQRVDHFSQLKEFLSKDLASISAAQKIIEEYEAKADGATRSLEDVLKEVQSISVRPMRVRGEL